MAEAATYTVLSGDAGVSALVASRIYPVRAPQDATFPYVTFQLVSEADRLQSLAHAISGLVAKRMQVDCFSETYAECKSLADAVRLALDRYNGTSGGDTIQGSHLESQFDDFEPVQGGAEKDVYRIIMDFVMWLQESTS